MTTYAANPTDRRSRLVLSWLRMLPIFLLIGLAVAECQTGYV